jgi:hypothetical protein
LRTNISGRSTIELTPASLALTIGNRCQEKIMKAFLNSVKLSAILGLLALAAGCATTKHTETFLTAAGFKVVAVTTPKQEQKLKSLPPDKITTVQRNGKNYYVFPDAAHHQIYLGTPYEYQNYLQIVADNKIAEQNRIGAEMESADGGGWDDWGSWEIITVTPN